MKRQSDAQPATAREKRAQVLAGVGRMKLAGAPHRLDVAMRPLDCAAQFA
ncbi:hypothetical protein [Paraburkholderia lycopersici]|nr:hypothetical protein [Paraburkholderia lycopersici]